MAIRVISAVIGLPILIFFVVMGGIYLQAAIAVVSLIGMFEFYMAVSKKIKAVHIVGFLTQILYISLIHIPNSFQIIITCAMLCIMILLVFKHNTNSIYDACAAIFGFLYVGYLMTDIFLIRSMEGVGAAMVWVPFICAWGSDTGAYFTGSAFGRHKLAPVLSPKKSVEGAIGGVISGAALIMVFAAVMCNIYRFGGIFDRDLLYVIIVFGIIGAVGAAFSQLGDLAASAVKRFTKIKDYGKIMPGHGGVLDRFDSVLFTAPAVYIMLRLIG